MTSTFTTFVPRLIGATGAFLLVSASAALGTFWGFQAGAHYHFALGLILAGAALGGEIMKPLAVAGMIDAFRARELARGLACTILAATCIVYSLAAELSLAAAGRGDLSATRQAASDANTEARGRRNRADAELRSLPPARTPAEVEPLIAKLGSTPGANGCRSTPDTISGRKACGDALVLKSEAARAQRRAELEAVIAESGSASGSSRDIGAADPLAATLSAYLTALGRSTPADTLAPWLALIPVLFLEIGSALALIVFRSINAAPANSLRAQAPAIHGPVADQIAAPVAAPTPDAPPLPHPDPAAPTDSSDRSSPLALVLTAPEPASAKPKRTTRADRKPPRGGHLARITDTLAAHGGRIDGGQRDLAKLFSLSKSRANEVIHELAASGHVTLSTCRTGTRIELATA